jgi:hypothetical protein
MTRERYYLVTLPDGDVMVISIDAPDEETMDALAPPFDQLLATLALPGR